MFYILRGHDHEYETQTMIQVFCPNDRYLRVDEPPKDGLCILCGIDVEKCFTVIYENGVIAAENYIDMENDAPERAVKRAIYGVFMLYKPEPQPWGILTGIRPAKIVSGYFRDGLSCEAARERLLTEFLMSEKKADLTIAVAKAEKAILDAGEPGSISLYIGVPFCPTRCLYCSFTSYPVRRYKKMMPLYFEVLDKELSLLGMLAKSRKIESVYFGGGTPTSLDAEWLERLLYMTQKYFDLGLAKEFTVEAGRPDTISRDKLKILKKYGVTRISINPQTMNDKTLEAIGREHTTAEFTGAFEMAREEGFYNINTDLILGLPGETPVDVENTFEQIARLKPEAVTVHTLAIKRASNLSKNLDDYILARRLEIERMLDISAGCCEGMGMNPYYMYRQKNMIGNFENVGYCKPGYECVYNVQIMEEKQSVFAAGAGAVTKIVGVDDKDKIERVFNAKGIEDYIARIEETLDKKEKLINREKAYSKGEGK